MGEQLMNKMLAICIPSYNRASFLKDTLQNLVPQTSPFAIPIYISDNASTDDTEKVVKDAQLAYPFIFYSRNESNLGLDKNVEIALKMSESRYSWLLGDDDRPVEDGVKKILEIIDQRSYDAIIINGLNRIKSINSCEYNDHNKLMSDLGWHMQWMSCLIYNGELLSNVDFGRYDKTYFTPILALFDCLAGKKDILVYWLNEPLVYTRPDEIKSYRTDGIKIFTKNWVENILALPDIYTDESKYKCIKDAGMTWRSMWYLRSVNCYNLYLFKKYKYYFAYLNDTSILLLFVLAIAPKKVLSSALSLARWLKDSTICW